MRALGFALLFTASGCYAAHDVRGIDATTELDGSSSLDASVDSETPRDARALLDSARPIDASSRDAAPDAPDSWSLPPCDPATVVWATPPTWSCGTAADPHIEVTPLDGWTANASANSCGIAVAVNYGPFEFRTTATWTSMSVRSFSYDGSLRWELTSLERMRAIAALDDGSVLGRFGVDFTGGWDVFDGASWTDRYTPEIRHGVDPSVGHLDASGSMRFYVLVDDAAAFGAAGPAFVEITRSAALEHTARILGRGEFEFPRVQRLGDRLYIQVGVYSGVTWLDGSVSSGPAELFVVIEGSRVVLAEPRSRPGLVVPHPDGSFTTIANPIERRAEDLRFEMRDRSGTVTSVRMYDVSASWPTDPAVVYSAARRPDGRIVLGGKIGSARVGDFEHYARGADAFLFEIDPCGGILWTRNFGADGPSEHVTELSVTPDGTVVGVINVAGVVDVEGTIIGDPREFRSALIRLAP